jgi:biopolymer transport protein ExbD
MNFDPDAPRTAGVGTLDLAAEPRERSLPVVPLLDLLLVLILLLAVGQVNGTGEVGVAVLELPTVEQDAADAPPLRLGVTDLVLDIRRDGTLALIGQIISAADLRVKLKNSVNAFQAENLVIRAHREAPGHVILSVIRDAQTAGLVRVSFAGSFDVAQTEKPEAVE